MGQRKLHDTVAEPNALVAHFCDGIGHRNSVTQISGVVLVTKTSLRSCIANIPSKLVFVQIHDRDTKTLQLRQKRHPIQPHQLGRHT